MKICTRVFRTVTRVMSWRLYKYPKMTWRISIAPKYHGLLAQQYNYSKIIWQSSRVYEKYMKHWLPFMCGMESCETILSQHHNLVLSSETNTTGFSSTEDKWFDSNGSLKYKLKPTHFVHTAVGWSSSVMVLVLTLDASRS